MNSKQKKSNSSVPPTLEVVIETPKGSRNKFKYEPQTHGFKLSKILPEGMIFPYDFGFVPSTSGPDGDPLDVLVLMDEPTFPGCLVECRPIGILESEQESGNTKIRNDRIIAVANQSLLYAQVNHLRDISPFLLKQIEAFFVNYQAVRNVRFKIRSRKGPHQALKLVRDSPSTEKQTLTAY
jgi:inorganic pyrophosphatase